MCVCVCVCVCVCIYIYIYGEQDKERSEEWLVNSETGYLISKKFLRNKSGSYMRN